MSTPKTQPPQAPPPQQPAPTGPPRPSPQQLLPITQQPVPRPPPQQQLLPPIPQATPSLTSTASAPIDPISCPETDEDVRNALLEWYSKECCFDQRPARRMKINAIIPMHAYRYILETFVEVRTIKIRSIPYTSPPLPPPNRHPVKWSVPVEAPKAPPGKLEIDFPDTSLIVPCSLCQATGLVVCPDCDGCGSIMCFRCFGRGYTTETCYHGSRTSIHTECCWYCHGSGREPCTTCDASGRIICPQCRGARFMKNRNYLEVVWSMDIKTHNTARGELVSVQLEEAKYSGLALVSQLTTPDKPHPLHFYPDKEITEVADKLVKQTLDPKNDWKIFNLRQSVVVIPVVQVQYQYRDIISRFTFMGRVDASSFRKNIQDVVAAVFAVIVVVTGPVPLCSACIYFQILRNHATNTNFNK